MKKISPYII